jgi:HD-GYP domain-containing protein (c-di-GMP phosphodiesterase class II)
VRVNKYAVIIARYMGLPEKEIRNVHVASLLHDVGKIGIDDAILKKPANLSADEFEIMKQHPEKGAKIMGRINALKDIVPGMRHHHERYGGGGYPSGLKGEEIPIIARIINVADTLDAMTTNRPYQSAFSFEAAVARINELKGSVCDPKVVEACNRAYRDGEFDLEARETAAQEVGQPMDKGVETAGSRS